MALAVAGAALVALATFGTTAADAGFRLRSPVGVLRSAMGRVLGIAGVRHARMHVRPGRVRTALHPQDLRAAVDPARPLSSAAVRGQLTAVAALAGWHGGRATAGWWAHADGSFGWVGPLFWPFADDDLADAILFGDATSFWAYGYTDIHAAVFGPYAATELSAYGSERRARKIPPLERFCGKDAGDGLPVERIADAIRPNEAQAAALDDLAGAWRSAAGIIRTHCQTQGATTGQARLAVMRSRIEALVEAVATIAPPLARFNDLLEPGQDKRLAALGGGARVMQVSNKQRPPAPTACQAALSGASQPAKPDPQAQMQMAMQQEQQARQFAASQWPVDDIAAALKLNDTQRAALDVLEDTTLRFLDPLNAACPSEPAATMPARLKAVQARLAAMLQAIKDTSDALDDLNYNLTDEQKAGLEAMGAKRGM
jgi:hypothetical protein